MRHFRYEPTGKQHEMSFMINGEFFTLLFVGDHVPPKHLYTEITNFLYRVPYYIECRGMPALPMISSTGIQYKLIKDVTNLANSYIISSDVQ